MSSRKIPAYRHQKSRNLAVVRLDGRDHYLGPWNSPESKAKYDRLISEWLCRNHKNGIRREPSTVRDLLANYVRFADQYYRKNGSRIREFGCIIESLRFVRRLHESDLVDTFGPLALKRVREAMVESGWSRKYINKQVARVVRMFKWGVEHELVLPGTWQTLRAVPGLKKGRTKAHEYEPVQPVSDAVVEATLSYLSSIVADMVRIHRLTGCRPTEICLFRPIDIDRSGDVWRFMPPMHKTEHQEKCRIILIGPQAQVILTGELQSLFFEPWAIAYRRVHSGGLLYLEGAIHACHDASRCFFPT